MIVTNNIDSFHNKKRKEIDYSVIPDELWIVIFSYLEKKALCRASVVDRKFEHLTRHPSIRQIRGFKDSRFSIVNSKSMEEWINKTVHSVDTKINTSLIFAKFLLGYNGFSSRSQSINPSPNHFFFAITVDEEKIKISENPQNLSTSIIIEENIPEINTYRDYMNRELIEELTYEHNDDCPLKIYTSIDKKEIKVENENEIDDPVYYTAWIIKKRAHMIWDKLPGK